MPETQDPYVSGINRIETSVDPLTRELLFGLDGQGGFIPGAFRAAERTFYDEQGRPRVIPQEIAGLSEDQLRAMQMTREQAGIQQPYLSDAESAYRASIGELGSGLDQARMRELQSLGAIQSGVGSLQGQLGDIESIQRGATGAFGTQLGSLAGRAMGDVAGYGTQLGDIESIQRGATGAFGTQLGALGGRAMGDVAGYGTQLGALAGRAMGDVAGYGTRLGESEDLLRQTTGAYDPSMTERFYNPYEDQVVQGVIERTMRAGDKQDMAQRARDIQTGGESAFGSRARLSAAERREALGRGLGQSIANIRAGGYSQAQQMGMGEFARQQAARRAASSGLAGMAGSRLGAGQNLTGTLTGMAGSRLGAGQNLTGTLTGLAGQQLGAQSGLASGLSSLAGTRFGAQQTQAGALSNLGGLEAQIGQQRAQAQMGLGGNLQNLGGQAQQAGAFGANQLAGSGQMQQQFAQQQLEAQRANDLQAQQAPLNQYQSLLPFVQTVPSGQQQTTTTYAPQPSALQAGLGVGLSTLGALGNFFNQGNNQNQTPWGSGGP